jgi:hypothetical protein
MQKSIVWMMAVIINLGISLPVLADAYDEFMKAQIKEFQPVGEDKCKKKIIQVVKTNTKITYELCSLDGKPIGLTTSYDGSLGDISSYKQGKILQIGLSEFGDGVGFRNGMPVVEWHSGEYGNRGINWNLTPRQKSNYLNIAAKERRILCKFGIC